MSVHLAVGAGGRVVLQTNTIAMKTTSLLLALVFGAWTFFAAVSELTDSRDGQHYRTVSLGGQTWMAENLNFATADAYCYSDMEQFCDEHGKLYAASAATSACPEGWHLPSRVEWQALLDAQGGNEAAYAKLAEDEGFNVDMGGFRTENGAYYGVGMTAAYRTADPNLVISFLSRTQEVRFDPSQPGFAYSCRCVKD